ncbi:hypothetical protein CBL_20810 [Carabus blaptoides fortunei]
MRDLMQYSNTTGGGQASSKTLSAGIPETVAEIQIIDPQISFVENVTIIEVAVDEFHPTNTGKRMPVVQFKSDQSTFSTAQIEHKVSYQLKLINFSTHCLALSSNPEDRVVVNRGVRFCLSVPVGNTQ